MGVSKFIQKWFAVFALPTLLAFAIAFIVPFLMGVGLSFTKFTTIENAKFNGISNYERVFSGGVTSFWHALGFTALFAVVSVVSINVIAFALALALTRGLKGTNIFRTIFFMPNLIGGIVLGYIWQILLNGLLVRITGKTLELDANYGFWGLVVVLNWQMVGYMMIIYIAGINNVPDEIIEAAQVDGASYFRTVRSVIVPMVAPSFTICTFLTLSNSFKLFDQNLSLTAGAPNGETRMLALDIYNTFYNMGPSVRGVGQAEAVIFFIMVAVVAFLQLRATRSKEIDA
jgi:raffinose/stachyose/melibiose transport system permease protein